MPTTIQAALLGVLQGVTEFLPVSSTAHLRLGEQLLGYRDPDGVFTVMIQLGSIFAIMWLYRKKIIDIVGGLLSRYEARHFALAIVVATIPALLAGALLSGFIKSVLYESPAVFAAAFIVGGLVMLVVERLRPSPVVRDAERMPTSRAFGIGLCQMLALIPGVSRTRSIRPAATARPRPARGRRILLLSGDADDDRGLCARTVRGPASTLVGARARHRHRLRRGVSLVPGGHHALPVVRQALGVCALRLVSHRPRAGRLRGDCRGLVVTMLWLRRSFIAGFFVTVPLFNSVAAFIWIFTVVDGLTTPFYDRVLGRRIPGLGSRRRPSRLSGWGIRHQRHRQAPSAARRSVAASRPGLPTIYARSSSSSCVLARQRVRFQARGDD
jgi:hypothetical protein